MGSGRRVLITNNTLAIRAGTELFVRDLAVSLVARGHSPIVYSSVLGNVAAELVRATVPVIDDLEVLSSPPDVIHAQHHLDAMCALLRFPAVPALYMCHGWQPWEEMAPVFPSIRRYVAVDDLCRQRLETTRGLPHDRIRTVYNAVDLRRFTPRPPLPARPTSALVFSNSATEANFGGRIRAACRAAGIERVDLAGRDSGLGAERPEELLPRYDLVFAKARCAIEAMAVGCAVVVADFAGLGGMVTPGNVESMRRLNFGVRTLQAAPVTTEAVARELARYDAAASAAVSAHVRAHADWDRAVDALESIYGEIAAEPVDWTAADACAAGARYLASLVQVTKARHEIERQEAIRAAAAAHTIAELAKAVEPLRAAEAAHAAELACVRGELDAIKESRTWRALGWYRRARAGMGSDRA